MFCSECGKEVRDNITFCPYCGEKIDLNLANQVQAKPESVSAKIHGRKPASKRKPFLFIPIAVAVVIVVLLVYMKQDSNDDDTEIALIEYSEDLYCKSVDEEKVALTPDKTVRYISDELILIADTSVQMEEIEDLAKQYNAEIVGYVAAANTYQIELNYDITYEDLQSLKEQLEDNEQIVSVYLNKLYSANESGESGGENYYPNDAEWADDWEETPGGENWAYEFLELPAAWYDLKNSIQTNTQNVTIGIFEVDTIDYTHEDLVDQFPDPPIGYASFINQYEGENLFEHTSHGTAVAGIIGAGFDNGIGMAGVVPDVSLQAVSWNAISEYRGSSNSVQDSSMVCLAGLAYLIVKSENQNTAVVNVSMGLEDISFAASRGNEAAIRDLAELNNACSDFLSNLLENGYDFLICKAAGNSNETENENRRYYYIKVDDDEDGEYGYAELTNDAIKKYKKLDDYEERIDYGNVGAEYDFFSGITDPDVASRIVVVGSVDESGTLSGFSCAGDRLDILAPGETISHLGPDNQYITDDSWGTSYSAAFVSGVAGLILSVDPTLTGAELKEILLDSATTDESSGYKVLNAKNAVEKVGGIKEDTENVDVYDAYDVILQEYRDACAVSSDEYLEYSEKYEELYPDINAYVVYQYHIPYHESPNGLGEDEEFELGYAYYDIDQNDTPELLIFQGFHESYICDIYAFDGTSAVKLLSDIELLEENTNFVMDIYDDGTICVHTSNADDYKYYQLNDDGYTLSSVSSVTENSSELWLFEYQSLAEDIEAEYIEYEEISYSYVYSNGENLSELHIDEYDGGELIAWLSFWMSYGASASIEDFSFEWIPGIYEYELVGQRSGTNYIVTFTPTDLGMNIRVAYSDGKGENWLTGEDSGIWIDEEYIEQ